MKKIAIILISLLMITLTACSDKTNSGDKDSNFKKIMFVVTGSLGGGTNNDSVYEAISEYTTSVNGSVNTFECNMDTSLYESTLMQASESGEYDLIVTGFGTMIEPLQHTAAKYPDQKFLIFDTKMDYTNNVNPNVISVQVLQNQGGFMAGVLAAELTNSTATLSNSDKVVGFVGAMESTAILDFLVGYIEGVKYVDSAIEVLYSFVGNHTDSALAKELGLSQYQQGADVIFAVGGNGMGVAEAALNANKYVIGVDYDYAKRLETTNLDTAKHVLTSVVKDYRGMVMPILEGINAGTVTWGTHSFISYKDGGVYLVKNDYTNSIVPAATWTQYNKIETEMINGTITVSTAFGSSTAQIDAIKSKAKPY